MTYSDLKKLIDTFTPEQLGMKAILIDYEEETANEIDYHEVTDIDTYWMDGDCYGDLESTMQQLESDNAEFRKDAPFTIEDFDCIPKGTVYLRFKDNPSPLNEVN